MKVSMQKLLKTNVEKMSAFGSEQMLLKTRYLGFSSEYVDENKRGYSKCEATDQAASQPEDAECGLLPAALLPLQQPVGVAHRDAAEVSPPPPNARSMRRMQDPNFREVRRITNLLLRHIHHEPRRESLGKTAEKQCPVSRDVSENKGVIRRESNPFVTLSHSNKKS